MEESQAEGARDMDRKRQIHVDATNYNSEAKPTTGTQILEYNLTATINQCLVHYHNGTIEVTSLDQIKNIQKTKTARQKEQQAQADKQMQKDPRRLQKMKLQSVFDRRGT